MTPTPTIIGPCTLYHGDCREILPGLGRVDAVVTDPVWPNCPDGLLEGSKDPGRLFREAMDRTDATRLVVILGANSDPRFISAVPPRFQFCRVVTLPYVMPARLGRYLISDEIGYCFGAPIHFAKGQQVIPGNAPKSQPHKRDGHPCPRSLDHAEWLMRWWSEPSDTVLDPFMGSGTTGVAAVKLGRKFIGIEIDERYFQIACERIEKAVAEAENDMFPPAQFFAEQMEMPK